MPTPSEIRAAIAKRTLDPVYLILGDDEGWDAALRLFGAVHYLATPVSADRLILAMLQDAGNADIALRDRPMSVHRITWEYIHHVLHENRGNISATARALSIDRRTLQRKLRKRPVAE